MNTELPLTFVLGELLADVQHGLVEEAQRRVHAAGFADVRSAHDCVFRFLGPEGIRLRDLAERAQMTPQSVGEHVDELEGLGYLERVPDPSDRRAKLIRPTAKGLEMMTIAREALADIEGEWKAAVGARSLTQLRASLEAIRELQSSRAARV